MCCRCQWPRSSTSRLRWSWRRILPTLRSSVVRGVFGSRARTLINTLLSFDAFFNWYYPMVDSIPLFADEPVKEQRAFDNMCSAIDMHEMFERLSIHNHKSFLIHGAVYKVTRDILNVGDVWAFCLSALELQNAETKRVASSSACKRLTLSTSGETRRPLGPGVSGPPQLVPTKGYGSTMVLSTMNHLLAAQKLRLCADLGENIAMPASRRASRLMHTDWTAQARICWFEAGNAPGRRVRATA